MKWERYLNLEISHQFHNINISILDFNSCAYDTKEFHEDDRGEAAMFVVQKSCNCHNVLFICKKGSSNR